MSATRSVGFRPKASITPGLVPVPPLENGDLLTRDEFERRYDAPCWFGKAELIDGEVFIPSRVHAVHHALPHADLLAWLAWYRAVTPGTRAAANCTIRLDLKNQLQPDGALLILPSYGGTAKLSGDDYINGNPELLGEISASTVSIDLNKKFHVYRRNKVREYVVWRVQEQAIDWFVLRGDDYERLQPDAAGVYRSEVFPGLWLDAPAMLRGDLATVLQKLQEGITSPEHAAFVAKLQAKAAGR